MALQTNSYGDVDETATMVPRYANAGGLFDNTTRPTRSEVESFTDQVSGVVNTILADKGFAIPITQADAKLMLDLFVNQEVAAIVEGVNSMGRFGPSAKNSGGKGRWAIIMNDVSEFVETMQHGIERLGATRSESITVQYAGTDESGDTLSPLFQVESHGYRRRDWDS